MKAILGIILIVVGTALGLYVGVWLCFIGGIVDVITEVGAEHIDALNVGIGVAKVFFAGLIGWLSSAVGIAPGYMLFMSQD